MIEIEKPNITTVNLSEDGRNGKFIIEPLERGYGILLYCNSFTSTGIKIITESRDFALLLPKLFKRTFNLNFDIHGQPPDA